MCLSSKNIVTGRRINKSKTCYRQVGKKTGAEETGVQVYSMVQNRQ